MKDYVVGMDGGGTKTAVSMADLEGNVRHVFTAGAMNFNGENRENIAGTFAGIFASLKERSNGFEFCRAVCIGTAGISNPEVKGRITALVRNQGFVGPLCVAGDHETALAGALGRTSGMILIAGTGSICYGVDRQGRSHRTGGFGYLIDDEGSGYAIGRDILSAVVRSYDGRGPVTLLKDLVFTALRVSEIEDMIGVVYKNAANKRDIAALSPLLTKACGEGDEPALRIAEKCGEELVTLVEPVAETLNMREGELALGGSVLLKDSYVQGRFLEKIKKRYPVMTCTMPRHDAAYGAVLMALELVNAR